ncbi:mob1/phocein family protein [Rhodotorula toruloides]|uniref:Mob1/phocein family protein n=1 Tax=Rhodotorula toruloides TaxID=5286 RepID=A0A511KHS5_RHOTO|nr:mob1/phocein family protein [Rhodotorula toruloides]
MGIGSRVNGGRSPSRPAAPPSNTQQPPHVHQHPQQQQQQKSQPPPGSGYSNAPLPRGTANGAQGTKGQQQTERLYLCLPFVRAALVKGNFKTIVALPKYVDVNEWVAVNLVDLFNNLNLFYSVVTEFCTVENNPTMSAGPGMDYTWIDASRKRVKLPAPQYIDYVLTWVEGLIKDEAVFPTKAGREFSPNFPSVARHIYTQLLRIFAHLYHAHYDVYLHLSMEGHLNSLFAHFLTFGREFDLLEPKECRAPKEGWPFVIGDLMDAWRGLGILEA